MSCNDMAAHAVATRLAKYLDRKVRHDEDGETSNLSMRGTEYSRCIVCAMRLEKHSAVVYALGRYHFFTCGEAMCLQLVAPLARWSTAGAFTRWFHRLILSITTITAIFKIRGAHG